MEARLAIVALYVGVNAFVLVVLAYNVGSRRGAQKQLQPGDMGDALLTRAIRAHANYAEYAPMVLLLLLILALLDVQPFWLHVYGATFTLGRIIGAFGMMLDKHPNALRFTGNLVTGLVLSVGGGAAIWKSIGLIGAVP